MRTPPRAQLGSLSSRLTLREKYLKKGGRYALFVGHFAAACSCFALWAPCHGATESSADTTGLDTGYDSCPGNRRRLQCQQANGQGRRCDAEAEVTNGHPPRRGGVFSSPGRTCPPKSRQAGTKAEALGTNDQRRIFGAPEGRLKPSPRKRTDNRPYGAPCERRYRSPRARARG